MTKLFSMAEELKKKNINVILIQIDEAHSDAWPMAIDHLLNVESTQPHKTFEDRIKRANFFIQKYNPPYPVYIDGFDNDFAEKFRAWPDKYHCIDNKLNIIAKSEYHHDEIKEATIIEDCTLVLEKLIAE